jgi:hypothetical protein
MGSSGSEGNTVNLDCGNGFTTVNSLKIMGYIV